MPVTQHVLVRHFTEPDADAVAALIRETLLTTNIADYPMEELELLAEWYSARGLVSRMGVTERLVAVVTEGGEQIVGTAARRENRLEGFFVAPAWQGKGVGEQLLAALEEICLQAAMRAIWLEASLTAVGFYERRGFTAAGAPRDNGDGLVVAMRKRL
jgi:GNAT superfamily N-acetyltransferase